MTIRFADNTPGNLRGQVQLFIENEVGRDNGFYTDTVSETVGEYVFIRRADFHSSESDPTPHITADVFHRNRQLGTAHVNHNGQVTIFHAGTD
ncbi:hypothetical protein C8Q73DRAFT_789865 [Cubamyces lactineus]|nr:hypothetical protein C8Q73DRAFT_789865 [Cubamyces lactineus]